MTVGTLLLSSSAVSDIKPINWIVINNKYKEQTYINRILVNSSQIQIRSKPIRPNFGQFVPSSIRTNQFVPTFFYQFVPTICLWLTSVFVYKN